VPGTWAAVGTGGGGLTSWGDAATATFAGSGSPVGVVTPSGEGDLYIDDTTPALWQATGVANTDWQQVGTSVQIQSSVDSLVPGATTAVPCDGEAHTALCVVADPPSWMDDAGNITAPGIYVLYGYLGLTTPDTTPGLFAFCGDTVGQAAQWQPIDPLTVSSVIFIDVVSLTDDNLPAAYSWVAVSSAVDITGVMALTPKIAQLVSGP
jgi:hypothetical protein